MRTVDPVSSVIVLRAQWDGSAAAGQKLMTEDVHPDSFVGERIGSQWELADSLVGRLGGVGDVCVTVMIAGGRFRRRTTSEPIVMRRGPILAGVDPAHVESMAREFTRAIGYEAPEP